MAKTRIAWTEKTWNPVTGCTKISAGCKHCYAQTMAKRLKAMGTEKYANEFTLTLHEDALEEPLHWKKSLVFVCSMGDLFHDEVPDDFIDKVLDIIAHTQQHTYQILTKRADRMRSYFSSRQVPLNAWIGVTVENRKELWRIDELKKIPAKIHFLSCEPLLESLGEIDLLGIEWLIVGGESGPKARFMRPQWVDELRDQAKRQNIPFFFKQWGTFGPDGIKRSAKANGAYWHGQIVQETPY